VASPAPALEDLRRNGGVRPDGRESTATSGGASAWPDEGEVACPVGGWPFAQLADIGWHRAVASGTAGLTELSAREEDRARAARNEGAAGSGVRARHRVLGPSGDGAAEDRPLPPRASSGPEERCPGHGRHSRARRWALAAQARALSRDMGLLLTPPPGRCMVDGLNRSNRRVKIGPTR